MAGIRGLLKENRGQGLVEMAIVLPVFILLFFGIIEFGRIFNAFLVTKEASREGARLAALGHENSIVVDAARDAAGIFDSKAVEVSISPSDMSNRKKGNAVTVTVSYTVDLVAPVISGILGEEFPVSASTVMRVE
ncbi:MAG TPA: pilus assembly protein [Clostridia bacterium]|jgi:Flp pilus assembly protein TadG|nr:pilus assembly protein [Clostridia bacterium]